MSFHKNEFIMCLSQLATTFIDAKMVEFLRQLQAKKTLVNIAIGILKYGFCLCTIIMDKVISLHRLKIYEIIWTLETMVV